MPALTILTPVCSCYESPGCYIGKSISSCLSKFVLSKILSSSGSSSMIDILRYTVKVYQPLTHNSLTQAPSRYFLQSLPLATSHATPLKLSLRVWLLAWQLTIRLVQGHSQSFNHYAFAKPGLRYTSWCGRSVIAAPTNIQIRRRLFTTVLALAGP